jgi:hypothetical protein
MFVSFPENGIATAKLSNPIHSFLLAVNSTKAELFSHVNGSSEFSQYM